MKQTRKIRKIRNKKLFLKWLKKSHKNNYNIVHIGGKPNSDLIGSEEITKGSTNVNKLTALSKGNAILLAGAVTLGEVAYSLASNPVVINAVLTLSATSMVAFASVMSGGGLAVLALVGLCVCLKVKALYSKYLIMMHVVNDYMLLLQKIDTMARIAVKLSEQYKFVIDTRDVNNSLQRIFNKFDKILSENDIKDINKQVVDGKLSMNDADKENGPLPFDTDASAGSAEEGEIEVSNKVKERQNGLFERFKRVKNYFSLVKKGYKLSSKKFSEELNDEVTRLGLYFSILLGELNIMLNVCQMDMIGNRENVKLIELNTYVKSDNNFKNLLISSIIYRTLQLYNIFELCKDSASSNATKKTCSKESIAAYITEIDTERTKINIVLFGKSKPGDEPLFPLYAPNLEKYDQNTQLEALRTIMRKYRETIDTKDEAQTFLDDIKNFNENLKKQNGKLGSSLVPSTSNITDSNYEIDYGEVGKAAEQPVAQDVKPLMKLNIKPTQNNSSTTQVPRLPPPPSSKLNATARL